MKTCESVRSELSVFRYIPQFESLHLVRPRRSLDLILICFNRSSQRTRRKSDPAQLVVEQGHWSVISKSTEQQLTLRSRPELSDPPLCRGCGTSATSPDDSSRPLRASVEILFDFEIPENKRKAAYVYQSRDPE